MAGTIGIPVGTGFTTALWFDVTMVGVTDGPVGKGTAGVTPCSPGLETFSFADGCFKLMTA
mgnify:CR=1 FL=1